MQTVIISGGFDPCHSGHISYINAARQLGDNLIIALNSDAWLIRKKGRAFLPFAERKCILENLRSVDQVIAFDDSDDSACDAIQIVIAQYPRDSIVFANGGDRSIDNIPEMVFNDVEFVFGVGGEDKKNSSSWILTEWKAPKTERIWGYYRVLHEAPGMKVKELTVNPGQALSMQRHQQRSEYWIVEEGKCCVNSMMPNGYLLPSKELSLHDEIIIPINEWHQLINPYDTPCRVVEIQYGVKCNEEDIERK